MSSITDLVRRFRARFLQGSPESYARMNKPGAISKYTKILDPRTRQPLPITDAAIAEHLSGQATYAAPLIGADGFTYEAALDIDAGGEGAIRAGLRIAGSCGLTAYGLVSSAGECGHNGGHIRIPLTDIAAPERARLLAEQIKAELLFQCALAPAGIEPYPTRKGLRLPFGVHTWTGSRGVLLLQDGTRLDLDAGDLLATLDQAVTYVETIFPNDPSMLPPLPLVASYNAAVDSSDGLQRAKDGTDTRLHPNDKPAGLAYCTRGAHCLPDTNRQLCAPLPLCKPQTPRCLPFAGSAAGAQSAAR